MLWYSSCLARSILKNDVSSYFVTVLREATTTLVVHLSLKMFLHKCTSRGSHSLHEVWQPAVKKLQSFYSIVLCLKVLTA